MWTGGEDGQPWLSEFALIAAVGASLLLFHVGGAPSTYSLVNAATLGLALIIMVASRRLHLGARGAAWVVGLGLSGICVTLVSGVDVEGVRRWIPLGPVRLHAAMLLLPAVLAALPCLPDRWRLACVALAAAIFVWQPDPAAALALAFGCLLAEWRNRRSAVAMILVATSVAGVIAAAARAVPLAPVPFVEAVLAQGFMLHAALGTALAAALLFAIFAPLFGNADRANAAAISGGWLGFSIASVAGPYPTPLAGYGAAAILGYGLAIAVLRAMVQFRIGSD
ncbi:hypothetical protein [Pelagerythrobacter aerophilus]